MHIHDSGHTQSVLCVDSPDWDDSLLASGSKDNSIFIWRLRPPTKQQLMEVDGDISAAGEDEAETPVIKPVTHATGHTHSVTRFLSYCSLFIDWKSFLFFFPFKHRLFTLKDAAISCQRIA